MGEVNPNYIPPATTHKNNQRLGNGMSEMDKRIEELELALSKFTSLHAKERLTNILMGVTSPMYLGHYLVGEHSIPRWFAEQIADVLIANGVVFKED